MITEATSTGDTNVQAEVNALTDLNVKQLEKVFGMTPHEVHEEFRSVISNDRAEQNAISRLLPMPFMVDPLLVTPEQVNDILYSYYSSDREVE